MGSVAAARTGIGARRALLRLHRLEFITQRTALGVGSIHEPLDVCPKGQHARLLLGCQLEGTRRRHRSR